VDNASVSGSDMTESRHPGPTRHSSNETSTHRWPW
jgi:hypothetical protein